MRILHIIGSIEPRFGGTSTVCRELAAAQAARGHHVTIAAYGSADDYPAKSGVHFVHIGPFPRLEQLISWRHRAKLEEVVRQHDIAHIHGTWEGLCLTGSHACVRLGVPYVHSPHGMLDEWALSEFRTKKKLALALGFSKLPGNAAAVMVSNGYEKECVLRTGLAKRVEFLPHGIDVPTLDRGMQSPKKGSELVGVGARPYMLFVGRIHEQKGLELLVRTWATICADYPQHQLVMCGPDHGELDLLLKLAAALNISDRVVFPGGLFKDDKAVAYRDCEFFITLTKHENFGMTLAEAMACRCAVITSEECYFQEVVPAGAGLEVPRDVAKAAAAMRQLLDDPVKTKQMGLNGRHLVDTNFVWPDISRRLSLLFEELIARKAAKSA